MEVLIPDFSGDAEKLRIVTDAQPDVLAHNIECVRRLTSKVRDPRAGYKQSLEVLANVKKQHPNMKTKSSIMVGVGENEEEVLETMMDLRTVSVDFLTIGQYLQPTKKHLKVDSFVRPETFEMLREEGENLGFKYVASGPLVRSSYKAGEFFIRDYLRKNSA